MAKTLDALFDLDEGAEVCEADYAAFNHIAELVRIAKTLFLLAYIDDEAYRRRILTQLNRGEGRHELARIIFHGKRGELRQRYREGQEDQLGALGLVVNAVILWNTIYMDAALDELRDRPELEVAPRRRGRTGCRDRPELGEA